MSRAFGTPRERAQALVRVVQACAAGDPDRAERFAGAISEDQVERCEALLAIAAAVADDEPEHTARLPSSVAPPSTTLMAEGAGGGFVAVVSGGGGPVDAEGGELLALSRRVRAVHGAPFDSASERPEAPFANRLEDGEACALAHW